MKIKSIILGVLIASTGYAIDSDLSGNIQIQSAKAIFRGTTLLGGEREPSTGNVDQLFGRANLNWAFQEDSVFSSLINIRAYPAGFGYEALIGSGWESDTTKREVPSIVSVTPLTSGNPTWHVYEAWIRYKFPDFDVRIGRMKTSDTRSIHFGNYLDIPAGGTFTSSRDGLHNALEFFKVYSIFHTKVHLGVGDTEGNRGYLRLYETIKPTKKLEVGLGYKVNVFDLINFDPDTDEANLTNTLTAMAAYDLNSVINFYMETSWSHTKGIDSRYDPIPTMAGTEITMAPVLDRLEVPPVMDKMRLEMEWLDDRMDHFGPYQGVNKNFLWNVYFAKTWLKRILLEGGVFAAPSRTKPNDIGVGGRFTSSIN